MCICTQSWTLFMSSSNTQMDNSLPQACDNKVSLRLQSLVMRSNASKQRHTEEESQIGHSPYYWSQLQYMKQQHQRSVSAQVSVNKDQCELHQHGWQKREEEREALPNLITSRAISAAQIQSSRRLGRKQRDRHKDRARQSHPHSTMLGFCSRIS